MIGALPPVTCLSVALTLISDAAATVVRHFVVHLLQRFVCHRSHMMLVGWCYMLCKAGLDTAHQTSKAVTVASATICTNSTTVRWCFKFYMAGMCAEQETKLVCLSRACNAGDNRHVEQLQQYNRCLEQPAAQKTF